MKKYCVVNRNFYGGWTVNLPYFNTKKEIIKFFSLYDIQEGTRYHTAMIKEEYDEEYTDFEDDEIEIIGGE
jgi:hypothetical protein